MNKEISVSTRKSINELCKIYDIQGANKIQILNVPDPEAYNVFLGMKKVSNGYVLDINGYTLYIINDPI